MFLRGRSRLAHFANEDWRKGLRQWHRRVGRVPARRARASAGNSGTAARLSLQPLDQLGSLRLGQVVGHLFARLTGKRRQIAALRTRHRLVTRDPLLGWLARVTLSIVCIAVAHDTTPWLRTTEANSSTRCTAATNDATPRVGGIATGYILDRILIMAAAASAGPSHQLLFALLDCCAETFKFAVELFPQCGERFRLLFLDVMLHRGFELLDQLGDITRA